MPDSSGANRSLGEKWRGKKREAEKKLDILYMLDKSLYDSLDVRINSF